MDIPSNLATDAEMLDRPSAEYTPFVELGTAGWAGVDEVLDAGELDRTTGTTAVDIVRVTLFRGHPMGKPTADDGGANGMPVTARLTVPSAVPLKGQQVVVLFPGGAIQTPGIGICLPVGGPTKRKLPNVGEGDVTIPGPAGQLFRMPAGGGWSLTCTDDGTPTGNAMYAMMIPQKGLDINTPWVRIQAGPQGCHIVTSSGARLDLNAIGGVAAPLDALASSATLQAAMVSVFGSAVSLGTDAGAANAAAVATLAAWIGNVILTLTGGIAVAGGAGTFNVPLSPTAPVITDIGKIC